MKGFKLIAAVICATGVTHAFAAVKAEPQLLSIAYVKEGSITVALPTVKIEDGSICTSYVAEILRDPAGKIDTTVKQVCANPQEQLVSLQFTTQDGLTTQTPVVMRAFAIQQSK